MNIVQLDTPPTRSRLLVVDDDEAMLMILQETLHREGYEVVTTTSPLEALDKVAVDTFSVIVSDQRMPEMSGVELLGQIQKIQPEATRILLTGVVDLKTVIDCINKGEIYRFLMKPWLHEELLMTMRNAVQRHELLSRNAQLHETTRAMNAQLLELNQSLQQKIAHEADQNSQLAKLNLALHQNLQRSVELCLKTMQSFYPSLGVQAQRVHGLCRAMATNLHLTQDQRQLLELSAWLHDVGLVGVPRRLIKVWQKSPDLLSAADLAVIQHHPVLGQELAGFVHHLTEVGVLIRGHHERFDGKGYPDRLAGDEIPWLGRLLAVAVGFVEAELKGEDGLDFVRHGSGKAFDPEAVRVFIHAQPHAAKVREEQEIPLSELRPGMVLARGIYTSNGMLLIPAGQVLNEPNIERLQNHHRVNPIRQTLTVYC